MSDEDERYRGSNRTDPIGDTTEWGNIVEFDGQKYIAVYGTGPGSCAGCAFQNNIERCYKSPCHTEDGTELVYATMVGGY